MKTFKFLTPSKPSTTGRYSRWGGTNTTGIAFNDGNTITRHCETLTANCNRLQYENFNNIIHIHSFRWVRNFNHRLILGENYRTNSEVYEGTIDRFIETYCNRRDVIRHATLPIIPVIERIEYCGSCFYADTLRFSNGNMWVKITYKKFYERV